MRKAIVALLLIAVSGFAATRILVTQPGNYHSNVINQNGTYDVIDSSESITSTVVFDVSQLPSSVTATDTLGYAWLRCADSAGTDSIAGKLWWEGNPSANANNTDWEAISSVTMTAGTGTTFLQTGGWVVNSKSYKGLRFKLTNQMVPAAGKKSKCYSGFGVKQRKN